MDVAQRNNGEFRKGNDDPPRTRNALTFARVCPAPRNWPLTPLSRKGDPANRPGTGGDPDDHRKYLPDSLPVRPEQYVPIPTIGLTGDSVGTARW